jgi:hypothetical protein
MLLNKYLSQTITFSVVMALSLVVMPKTEAAAATADYNYAACLVKLRKIDDVSKLRNQAIKPAADKRLARLTELKTKAAPLSAAYKNSVLTGIAADETVLKDIVAKSAQETDIRALQADYCQVLFKAQTYTLRTNQVNYLKTVDARLNRDTKFQAILSNPYNSNVKSLLKADIDARYNNARALIAANVAGEKASGDQLAAAHVNSDYTNTLVKPTYNGVDVKTNFNTAYKQYSEASVLRKAASSYSADRTLSLVSVELKDQNDKVLTSDFSQARKATVVVNVAAERVVSGEKGKSTRQLVRDDSKSVWRIKH